MESYDYGKAITRQAHVHISVSIKVIYMQEISCEQSVLDKESGSPAGIQSTPLKVMISCINAIPVAVMVAMQNQVSWEGNPTIEDNDEVYPSIRLCLSVLVTGLNKVYEFGHSWRPYISISIQYYLCVR